MTDMSAVIGAAQAGQAAVPNYAQQQLLQSQAGYYGAEAQRTQTQNQQLQFQNQMARYQMARTQQFYQDMRTLPYQQLVSLYPDHLADIKAAHDEMAGDQQQAAQTQLGSAVAYSSANDYNGAARILQDSHNANKAVGRADSFTPGLIDDLASGDKKRQLAAHQFMVNGLASTYGAKDAPGMLDSLGVNRKHIALSGTDRLVDSGTGSTLTPTGLPYKDVSWTDAQGVTHPGTMDQNTGQLFNGGTNGPAPAGAPAAGTPATGGTPGTAAAIAMQISSPGVEGTGKNPKSTAQGYGQFLKQTWIDNYKKHADTTGMTDAQILAKRNDPTVAGPMLTAFTQDNMDRLKSQGIAPTPTNTYLTHLLGPSGGPAMIQAMATQDPSTPVASIISHRAAIANPRLAKMTIGQMQKWASAVMKDSGQAQQAAAPQAAMPGGVQVASNTPLGPGDMPQSQQDAAVSAQDAAAAGQGAPYAHFAGSGADGGPVAAIGALPQQMPQAPAGQVGVAGGPQAAVTGSFGPSGTDSAIPNTKGATPGSHWGRTQDGEVPGREYPNKGSPEDFAGQDPTTKESMFRDYVLQNKSPPVNGSSGTAFKAGFDREVGPWMAAHGIKPADLPAIRQQFSTDSANQMKAAKTASGMKTAADSIKLDGEAVVKAAKALEAIQVLGNNPLQNKANLVLWSHAGTAETQSLIKSYHDAFGAYKSKVARFLSTGDGNGGAGGTTEGASSRAAELNDPSMPVGVLVAHINQNGIEVDNARSPWVNQAYRLDRKMRGYLGGSTDGAPADIPHVTNASDYSDVASGQKFYDTHGNLRTKR